MTISYLIWPQAQGCDKIHKKGSGDTLSTAEVEFYWTSQSCDLECSLGIGCTTLSPGTSLP